jgi:hypothetical protein
MYIHAASLTVVLLCMLQMPHAVPAAVTGPVFQPMQKSLQQQSRIVRVNSQRRSSSSMQQSMLYATTRQRCQSPRTVARLLGCNS